MPNIIPIVATSIVGFAVLILGLAAVLTSPKANNTKTPEPMRVDSIMLANNDTTPNKPVKQAKPNPQKEAQERKRWAAQYQANKRAGDFPSMVCTVSGKHNTTIRIHSTAAITVGVAETLNDSGYFNDVFEQGFTKIILTDDAGHEVTITR